MQFLEDSFGDLLNKDLIRIDGSLDNIVSNNDTRSSVVLEECKENLAILIEKSLYPFLKNQRNASGGREEVVLRGGDQIKVIQMLFVAFRVHMILSHTYLFRLNYAQCEENIMVCDVIKNRLKTEFDIGSLNPQFEVAIIKYTMIHNSDMALLNKRLKKETETIKYSKRGFKFLRKNEKKVIVGWFKDDVYDSPHDFVGEHCSRLYHYFAEAHSLKLLTELQEEKELEDLRTEIFNYMNSFVHFSRMSKFTIYHSFFFNDYSRFLSRLNKTSEDNNSNNNNNNNNNTTLSSTYKKEVIELLIKNLKFFTRHFEVVRLQRDKLILFSNLASTLCKIDPGESSKLFKKAYHLSEEKLPSSSIEKAFLYQRWGELEYHVGRNKRAIELWRISSKIFGEKEYVTQYSLVDGWIQKTKDIIVMKQNQDRHPDLYFDDHDKYSVDSGRIVGKYLNDAEMDEIYELLTVFARTKIEDDNISQLHSIKITDKRERGGREEEEEEKISREDKIKFLDKVFFDPKNCIFLMTNLERGKFCAVCGNNIRKLLRCSVCKVVSYCSRDHQIKDWKRHKSQCKKNKKKKKKSTQRKKKKQGI